MEQSGSATPIAEGALQAVFWDDFTLSGANPTTPVRFHLDVDVSAPNLNFMTGDFYSYAVGYQIAVFDRLGSLPTHEYGSAADLYWMDARLDHGFSGLPTDDTIVLQSIGRLPPGQPGVDYEITDSEVGGLCNALPFTFNAECGPATFVTRSYPDPSPALRADFDDPLMPFLASISSVQWEYDPIAMQYVENGDIQLPTGTPLRIVVNLFIEAGCSDANTQNCELDVTEAGGAPLGIELFESGVTLAFEAGFQIPVLPAPEPATGASFVVACAALASLRRRRRGCDPRYAARIDGRESR